MDQSIKDAAQLRPAQFSEVEWKLRLELAACYRLVDWFGWTELVFNHITARVPGLAENDKQFLINPFGLHYGEVTASNLVRINLDGDVLDGSPYPINRAGFVIHSAIHAARDDAHCVLHTHTTAGMAVSCKAGGLRNDNFYSVMLNNKVAYHDFEGTVTDLEEQPRLVANLGRKNLLILRNHGLLAIGRDISQMFISYWTLERACQIQMAADSMAGPGQPVTPAVVEATPMRAKQSNRPKKEDGTSSVFEAMLRKAGIRYDELV